MTKANKPEQLEVGMTLAGHYFKRISADTIMWTSPHGEGFAIREAEFEKVLSDVFDKLF